MNEQVSYVYVCIKCKKESVGSRWPDEIPKDRACMSCHFPKLDRSRNKLEKLFPQHAVRKVLDAAKRIIK